MIPNTLELHDLMAHGAWLRRIAVGLLQDLDEADDAVAETWVAAHRHRPAADRPPRPWLGRVVMNLARNRLRAARRRKRHEADAVVGLPDVPTPEAMAAALELQRRVALLVQRLPEPYRQVVFLRYVEDLEPAQIAARLGIPAGTARWRLKTGLDQLRRALDESHGGDRRRWVAVLGAGGLLGTRAGGTKGMDGRARPAGGPIADGRALPTGRPVADGRGSRLIAAGTVAAAGALAIGVIGWRHLAADPARPVNTATALIADGTAAPPAPPAPAPVLAAATADCPEARALREEVAMRERELAPRRPFEITFRNSPPNPVAERRFGAVLAQAYERAGHCSHRLECRGLICRVESLIPKNIDRQLCRSWPPGVRFGDYLNRWRTQQVARELYREVVDPISGERLDGQGDYYHLATATGDPVPEQDQPPLPPIAPGRHRPRPPLSSRLPGPCRQQAERELQRLRQLELEGDRHLPLPEQFAAGDPDPQLAGPVTAELQALAGPPPSALTVHCRGLVCQLQPPPALSWFRRLTRGLLHSSLLATSWFSDGSGTRAAAAFVRVYPPDQRQAPSALSAICRLAERARAEGLLDRCASGRAAPGSRIDLDLNLDPAADPPHDATISVTVTGPSDAMPFVECLSGELRALAARQDAVRPRDKLRTHSTFELPATPRIWRLGDLCPF
jgi:RNA polymerase sigma factor (sigma-70 family)